MGAEGEKQTQPDITTAVPTILPAFLVVALQDPEFYKMVRSLALSWAFRGAVRAFFRCGGRFRDLRGFLRLIDCEEVEG